MGIEQARITIDPKQEGVAGAALHQCGVEFDGRMQHPETGKLVPDTRVAAIIRLAPVLRTMRRPDGEPRLDDKTIDELRSAGIDV